MRIRRVLGSSLVTVLVATTVAVATAPAPAFADGLVSGAHYAITNSVTFKNLAVNGGQDQNGAKIIQYDWLAPGGHLIADQTWELRDLGNGRWALLNLGTNPHKALAINNHGLANGVGAIQFDYHPEYADQVWEFPSVGNSPYWKLRNLNSGKCLAIAGGDPTNGKQAIQYTCDNSYADQLWDFHRVSS